MKHYDLIHEILREVFKSAPRDHWLKMLEEKDVPSAPITTLDEVFQNPQVRHLDRISVIHDPDCGAIPLVKNGVTLSETPVEINKRPPRLGEDTEETLQKLGLNSREISKLKEKGVI